MKHTTESNAKKSLAEIKKEVNEARVKENALLMSMTPAQRVEYLKAKAKPINSNGLTLTRQTAKKIAKEEKASRTVNTKTAKGKGKVIENPYEKAVTDFEQMFIENNGNIPCSDITTYTLAKAIFFNVIKKIIQVSSDKVLEQMRYETLSNIRNYDNFNKRTYADTLARLNKDGQMQYIVNDTEYEKAVDNYIGEILSMGNELINTAVVELIQQANYFKAHGKLEKGFLTIAIQYKKIKSKVYILNGKTKVEYTYKEMTPLQLVYGKVRQAIRENESVKASVNGYSYISVSLDNLFEMFDYDENTENTLSDTVNYTDFVDESYYIRLPKHIDLGVLHTDFNGKATNYTISDKNYKQYCNIISKAKANGTLSEKHITYITLSLKGLSREQIAKAMGISESTTKRIQTTLQNTLVSMGIGDESLKHSTEYADKPKAVIAIDTNGHETYFQSVKQCSIALNIDRCNITNVLNGKRSTAKGYKFKYKTVTE